MISTVKLIKLAQKWQRLAGLERKRISWWQRTGTSEDSSSCSASLKADKGHFVLYSAEGKRFMIPLAYLHNKIVKGLLQAAEEEFGISTDGPIKVPCDAVFVEYALSLIQRRSCEDLQKLLITSIASSHYTSSEFFQEQRNTYQAPICSF